jgi:N-acetylglucosamine malate deacetylase 1
MSENAGWPAEGIEQRKREIETVAGLVGFHEVFQLGLEATRLDVVPLAEVVQRIGDVIRSCEPDELLVPSANDAHSDHRVVFDAVSGCAKWFRYPSVKRVMAYETLSETDFSLRTEGAFRPNCFVDISAHLERKLEIMSTYASEMGEHPFPRSTAAIRALATLRGAASGFLAAEAFEMLRERS